MSVEVSPPQLAALIDVAERPRAGNWSLRAALTRYGQPQPQRTSNLIEVLRRIEVAVHGSLPQLHEHGPDLWDELTAGAAPTHDHAALVELLKLIRDVDEVGDALADWANDKTQPRPDDRIDAVAADAMKRLDALGVPREEERRPPTRGRG